MSADEPEVIIDEPIVAQLLDLGPEVMAELIDLYGSQLTTLMPGVRSADRDESRRAAHTLKGSSANLGLVRVAHLAATVEDGNAASDAPERIETAAAEGLAELRTRIA